MKNGVNIQDKDGEDYGKSKSCGKSAVLQTGASRFIMPIPCLAFPIVSLYTLQKMSMVPKNRIGKLFLELTICFLAMTFAVPFSVSIFPVITEVKAKYLEQ